MMKYKHLTGTFLYKTSIKAGIPVHASSTKHKLELNPNETGNSNQSMEKDNSEEHEAEEEQEKKDGLTEAFACQRMIQKINVEEDNSWKSHAPFKSNSSFLQGSYDLQEFGGSADDEGFKRIIKGANFCEYGNTQKQKMVFQKFKFNMQKFKKIKSLKSQNRLDVATPQLENKQTTFLTKETTPLCSYDNNINNDDDNNNNNNNNTIKNNENNDENNNSYTNVYYFSDFQCDKMNEDEIQRDILDECSEHEKKESTIKQKNKKCANYAHSYQPPTHVNSTSKKAKSLTELSNKTTRTTHVVGEEGSLHNRRHTRTGNNNNDDKNNNNDHVIVPLAISSGGFRLGERKILSDRRRIVSNLCLLTALFGIVCMIVETELCMANVYSKVPSELRLKNSHVFKLEFTDFKVEFIHI